MRIQSSVRTPDSVTMHVGGVPERSNGAVLKTVGRASASWVRIPPPPLRLGQNALREPVDFREPLSTNPVSPLSNGRLG